MPITSMYDVPLMVARGYASLSFLHSAAEYISEIDVPTYIYHLGDFDPSGVNAGEKIEQTLRDMAPAAELHFERIGVTSEQIGSWNLPTRPTKQSDTRAKNFGDISVELDAIEPDTLRALVEIAIQRHLSRRQFEILKAAEGSERLLLRSLVDSISTGGGSVALYLLENADDGLDLVRKLAKAISDAHVCCGLADPTTTWPVPLAMTEIAGIQPPRSWPKEEKRRFLELPYDLQVYLAKHEDRREKEIRKAHGEADMARKELAKAKDDQDESATAQ